MPLITVTAPVRPTEDPERVASAALRFFPDGTVDRDGDTLVVAATDLERLRKRIWELRIIDTFRSRVLSGLDADRRSFTVMLSKQAAFAGRVSFPAAPHALGDLRVTVAVAPDDAWDDAEALAWWLCPETRDGEIVGPTGPPGSPA